MTPNKVRYIGDYYKVVLQKGKIYDVLGMENGWYQLMTELDETGFFSPDEFEIADVLR